LQDFTNGKLSEEEELSLALKLSQEASLYTDHYRFSK
jgi:hypothetical protein